MLDSSESDDNEKRNDANENDVGSDDDSVGDIVRVLNTETDMQSHLT